MARLRVLIIGAGRRVQNNFLPVLHCLRDHFVVAGIHARTPSNLLPVARRWNLAAVPTLETVDWDSIDVVVLSVTVSQNVAVLRQLMPRAARLRLLIDTPVATTLADLAAAELLLPQFAHVLVTEDYMNFPQFSLAREAMADGLIGKATAATLLNIGYFFHGLALLRSFAGFSPVLRSHAERVGRFASVVDYRLRGGFRACVVGPYRPDSNGGLLLEGTSGVISEVASDARWGNTEGRPHYMVVRNLEHDQLVGFRIETAAGEVVRTLDLPWLREMRALPFEDKSDLNLCRGCGLLNVFRGLLEPQNLNHAYGFRNALYDSFVSRLADRGRLPIDPLTLVGSDIMAVLRRLGGVQGAVRHAMG